MTGQIQVISALHQKPGLWHRTTHNPEDTYITLDRTTLETVLEACLVETELSSLRERIVAYRAGVSALPAYPRALAAPSDVDTIVLQRDAFLGELDQILAARTVRRAVYYLSRLQKGIGEARLQ